MLAGYVKFSQTLIFGKGSYLECVLYKSSVASLKNVIKVRYPICPPLRRWWMVRPAPQTPPRSVSKESASKPGVTANWVPTRSSTSAESVGETTETARKSLASSQNPCE